MLLLTYVIDSIDPALFEKLEKWQAMFLTFFFLKYHFFKFDMLHSFMTLESSKCLLTIYVYFSSFETNIYFLSGSASQFPNSVETASLLFRWIYCSRRKKNRALLVREREREREGERQGERLQSWFWDDKLGFESRESREREKRISDGASYPKHQLVF